MDHKLTICILSLSSATDSPIVSVLGFPLIQQSFSLRNRRFHASDQYEVSFSFPLFLTLFGDFVKIHVRTKSHSSDYVGNVVWISSIKIWNYIFCVLYSVIFSRHPEVLWAQRSDKVYLTIALPDAKDISVKCEPQGSFSFSAVGVQGEKFDFSLQLYGNILPEVSLGLMNSFNFICSIRNSVKNQLFEFR